MFYKFYIFTLFGIFFNLLGWAALKILWPAPPLWIFFIEGFLAGGCAAWLADRDKE
jgi:hypothetical protein